VIEKIILLALCFLFLPPASAVEAQQPGKVYRIGLLRGSALPEGSIEAFRRGLNQLGYIEGKNITLEYRWRGGKGNPLPDLAAELVALKVDIIVGLGGAAAMAAKNTTATIPIIFVTAADPIENGLVTNFARPSGNVTGLSLDAPGIPGKRLELLKESFPSLTRVAVLHSRLGTWKVNMAHTERAAEFLKVQLQPVSVDNPNEIEKAFAEMKRDRAEAFVKLPSGALTSVRQKIVDLAARSRRPAMYDDKAIVEAGGLMSYAANEAEGYRRAATYVDKILKGAKPADLPVEQPIKFEFIVNLKAAKQIGLTIPPNVLVRADRVIR
jgi:putative ABC transport system substrate-binding protein